MDEENMEGLLFCTPGDHALRVEWIYKFQLKCLKKFPESE